MLLGVIPLVFVPLAPPQETWVVTLDDMSFQPAELEVALGDRVRWVWGAGFHNVISGWPFDLDGAFDSGPATVPPFEFEVTFGAELLLSVPKPGHRYPYFCGPHFAYGMWGTVDVEAPLEANAVGLGLAAGGVQEFTLRAGEQHAGALFFLLGSASGTAPGIAGGGLHLPLNPDAYLVQTLIGVPFLGGLEGALGRLDEEGAGSASFELPAGSDPALAGLALAHAFVVLDPGKLPAVVFASNAVPLLFTP